MSRYRVDPGAVNGVLLSTAAEADDFADLVEPVASAVSSAVTDAGDQGTIALALRDLMDLQGQRLRAVAARASACVKGAAEATIAFDRGDTEMAERHQLAAVRRANVHPSSFPLPPGR